MLLAVIALLFPSAAFAQYKYRIIDYPGAQGTTVFGLNSSGRLVGTATIAEATGLAFEYSSKRKLFTPIPTAPGSTNTLAFGINDHQVIVGAAAQPNDAPTRAYFLANGAFTFFEYPGALFTEARAINNRGNIVGRTTSADGEADMAFIYDSKRQTFSSFGIANSLFMLAQGVNNRDQIVGGALINENGAYAGSPSGFYAFLRQPGGELKVFRVNGLPARARGINDDGTIVGWLNDPASARIRGFVVRKLADGTAYQDVTVTSDDLLDVPGAVFTFAQDIDNRGRIVGSWTDAAGVSRGFIATPIRDGDDCIED
jgi:uncharacterized membrane protein